MGAPSDVCSRFAMLCYRSRGIDENPVHRITRESRTLQLLPLLTLVFVAIAFASDPSFDKKQTPLSPGGSSPPGKEVIQCLRKGHEALDKKDLDEAVKSFRACVEQHPKSGLAHYWLGQSYLFTHKTDDAIAEIKEALQPGTWERVCPACSRSDLLLGQEQVGPGRRVADQGPEYGSPFRGCPF